MSFSTVCYRLVPFVAVAVIAAGACSSSPEEGDDASDGQAGRGGEGGGQGGQGAGDEPQGGSMGETGGEGGMDAPPEGGTGGEVSNGGAGGTMAGGAMAGGSGGTAVGGSGGTAGGMAGSGGTPAAKALLNADFENGTVGQAPPMPFAGSNPNIKVDSAQAYSGTKSVKVVSASGSTMFSVLAGKINLPAPRKTAYTRFMVYMDNLPGSASGGGPYHWDFVKYLGVFKGGGFNVNGFLSYGGFSTSQQKFHMFGDDTGGKGRQDCVKQAPFVMKAKTWTCVEMKVDANDIINYSISIDGQSQQALSFLWDSAASNCVPEWNILQGSWYLPEISTIQFGFNHVNHSPRPVTLWMDDIAVDTKPIGCPPPK